MNFKPQQIMKKIELHNELLEIVNLSKSDMIERIKELAESVKPKTVARGPKKQMFVRVHELNIDPSIKYPNQMLKLHKVLSRVCIEDMPLADVKKRMDEKPVYAKLLKTRQNPSRIYAWYQKRLMEEGALEHVQFDV